MAAVLEVTHVAGMFHIHLILTIGAVLNSNADMLYKFNRGLVRCSHILQSAVD